jgi:hypothetical protein
MGHFGILIMFILIEKALIDMGGVMMKKENISQDLVGMII